MRLDQAAPRLDVAVLRGHGPVDEVEVDVVHLEAIEAVLQRALGLVEAVAVVEALGRDEDVVAVEARGVDGLPDGGLVAVGRGGVDVPVAREQRAGGGLSGLLGRHLEDPEAELRDLDVAAQRDGRNLAGGEAHALALPGLGLAKRGLRRQGQTFRGLSHVSQPAPRFAADTLAVSVTTNGHRVLVVDDEPNIVDVVTMALRFQGFSVESAGTGAQALAAVRVLPPAPHRARRDAARHGGLRRRPAPRGAARSRADHLPDRARRDRGQDPRAEPRRRRLRHQALQPRGARRADPVDPAPHRGGRARVQPAGLRGHRARRGRPRGAPRRRAWSTSLRPSTACCAT